MGLSQVQDSLSSRYYFVNILSGHYISCLYRALGTVARRANNLECL
jgi:hypothetical protein